MGSVIEVCRRRQTSYRDMQRVSDTCREQVFSKGRSLKIHSLKFVCRWTNLLLVENTDTRLSPETLKKGDVLRIPVANGEGNFYMTDRPSLNTIERQCPDCLSDTVMKKADPGPGSNPNGSVYNIAGICNPGLNVLGMMPHPERSYDDIIGGSDGRLIFESVISWIQSN